MSLDVPSLEHAAPHTTLAADEPAPVTAGTLLAIGENALAGRIIYWRLEGDVDAEELAAVWTSPEKIPTPRGPNGALFYATSAAARARDHLVRRIPGGYAVVKDETNAHANLLARDAVVTRDAWKSNTVVSAVLVEPETEGGEPELRFDPPDSPYAVKITEEFAYYRRALTTREIATALPAYALHLGGVSLRDTGGVYFIPHDALPAWDAIQDAFRRASDHRFFGVAVTRAEDAAEAFLDAVAREAQAFLDSALSELPALGKRARATVAAKAQAMTAKVARYEALFGADRHAALRGALDALENSASVAEFLGEPTPEL